MELRKTGLLQREGGRESSMVGSTLIDYLNELAQVVDNEFIVSGVDNKKFGGKRATPKAIEDIARANSMDTLEGREAVYSKLRPEIH